MCLDLDSRPPIPPLAGAAVDGERIELTLAGRNPLHGVPRSRRAAHRVPAMLILPDVRGLHPFYEELALRFAEAGIEALAIDYFGRTAPTDRRAATTSSTSHTSSRPRTRRCCRTSRPARDFLVARPRCADDLQRRLLLRRTARVPDGRARGARPVGRDRLLRHRRRPGRVDMPAPVETSEPARRRCSACSAAPTRPFPQDVDRDVRRGTRRRRRRQRAGHLSRRAALVLRSQGGRVRRCLGRRVGTNARVRAPPGRLSTEGVGDLEPAPRAPGRSNARSESGDRRCRRRRRGDP